MSIVVGVGIVVLNTEGQVLAGIRLDSQLWGLPGGRVEFGETIKACAQRELLEETGLELPLSSFKVYTVVNCIRQEYHSVDFTVVTAVIDGQVPINTEPLKCAGWEWKTWEELIELPMYWPLQDRLTRGMRFSLSDYASLPELDVDLA